MKTIAALNTAVTDALAYLSSLPDIREAEVFAASNRQCVLRLNYTSHIPSNGVEEPKSKEDYGIGVRAVFNTPDGPKVGFGSEANTLSLEGIKLALEKARDGAVLDPEFTSLPRPIEQKRTLYDYHDPHITALSEEHFVEAGWKILDGAVDEFASSGLLKELARQRKKTISELGLIVGGDLTLISERIAIASTSMPEVQNDESTITTASITAMVEECDAKGSGYGQYTTLAGIDEQAGRSAAKNALAACGILGDQKGSVAVAPVSVPSGTYAIVFGPQPVSDMFNNLVLPGLTTGSFYGSNSPFMGCMGKRIISARITVVDDATNKAYVGAKGITCEGLPTKRTELITKGVLTDLLSDWYETNRTLHCDPQAAEKLGADPQLLYREGKLLPTSGFRFNQGGGRGYDLSPGTSGTNTMIYSDDAKPLEALIQKVQNGIFIGRIWY
ncbi:MAG: hypothetical protein A3B29_04235, partial [Candidatus Sungbacteria bacterium RIFCSPLOWO2_01_FULL_51_34]